MRKFVLVAVLIASVSGCVVRAHGRINPVAAIVGTGIAVAAVAAAVSTPPPVVVDVGYAGEYRPGYVWVNGYQRWNGSAYVWTAGYYQPARAGYYWVQPTYE